MTVSGETADPEPHDPGSVGPDPAEGPAPGPAVLDASAVLAWLQGEPGADVVQTHLDDAVICAVNFAEIHQKLAQNGVDADRTTRLLRTAGVRVEPFDADDAIAASKLWPTTRKAGLSLGDRCCLALAARLWKSVV